MTVVESNSTNKSKKKRKIIIVTSIIVVVIIAIVLVGLHLKKENDYKRAITFLDENNPYEASLIFEDMAGYKESDSYLIECKYKILYNDAIDKFDYGEYIEAWDILNKIEEEANTNRIDIGQFLDYEMFESVKAESYTYACYQNGVEDLNNENYYDAYSWLNKANGILDSNELAKTCIQTLKTEELYFNNLFFWYVLAIDIKLDKDYPTDVCIKILADDTLVSVLTIEPGKLKTVELPSGYYTFLKGEGENWFGEKDYFGEYGSYYRFVFDEDVRGNVNEEFEVHLEDGYRYNIVIANEMGNVKVQSISYDEFKEYSLPE